MQYCIEHIVGWKNPAIIRVKDGAVIGHVYAEHEDELKPYLGQGVEMSMTFDELKSLLREWYILGKEVNFCSMAGVDAWVDANYRLKEYARTLYEGGKAGR